MIFMLRLYAQKVMSMKLWLLPALVPPLIYLLAMASEPDVFTVYQDIAVPEDPAYAVTTSPVDYVPLSEIVEHPANFFLERFIVKELHTILYPDTAFDAQAEPLRSTVYPAQKNMTLAGIGDDRVRVRYHGPEREKGRILVSYFSGKLMKKVSAGMRRRRMQEGEAGVHQQKQAAGGREDVEILHAKPLVAEHTAVFRTSRIVPAAVLFGITLAIILLWIAILESTDTSLKSERQAARYLDLPAIGSLPNLNKLPHRAEH